MTLLFVEKVFAADGVEGSEARGPARHDLFGSHARLQLLDGFRVSDEQKEFRGIELLGIELLQGDCDFQFAAPHAPPDLNLGEIIVAPGGGLAENASG